ncbi:hypothetical protein L1987_77530 [Smallanthus sonchifolius]|uniref:Uncharacterized protein n=1 Tax=Smallanthus sonchifolius TaxID=185202 RepID=A0ACB8ZB30_9ASTR|nr:hypothetical protein L1987_77530 [Smallanthus sonchifolius]
MLVQQKQYLYVRVVKGKDLLAEYDFGGRDCYVEVRLGNHKETTRCLTFHKWSPNAWNQVFAFLRDKIEATMLEVTVKDYFHMADDFRGWVLYDLSAIPKRLQPDSPQWHRLVDRKGDKLKGELMLALWWGTQADEAFLEADSLGVVDDLDNIHLRKYYSPRLWYLRVDVIEGQDLIPCDTTRPPESFVKATLGNQSMRTRISMMKSTNPVWNEELMFVAEEPFEEHLILSVEDRVGPNKDERDAIAEGQETKQGRIHMRICLGGGFHVLQGSAHYSSDLRPAAHQLCKKNTGFLELGILSAHGLSPMKTKDGRATTDAYCVAMYGTEWVRTRTIIDSFTPKWDEHYYWQVFDPCTIVTIGVFDNFHLQGEDTRIGKVRIRVSTLETGRVYTHWYPLLVSHPSGVKKMGEIHLKVRFNCAPLLIMMHKYSRPLLPDMHYIHPITISQLDSLTHHANQMVCMRLSQDKEPLRKDIVEYMLDVGCETRQSKVNFLRIKGLFGGLITVGNWFIEMYSWKNPISTVVTHIIIFIFAIYPELILPSIFLSFFNWSLELQTQTELSSPH